MHMVQEGHPRGDLIGDPVCKSDGSSKMTFTVIS